LPITLDIENILTNYTNWSSD